MFDVLNFLFFDLYLQKNVGLFDFLDKFFDFLIKDLEICEVNEGFMK